MGLGGELRPISGVLPAIPVAHELGRPVMLPMANCAEASLVQDVRLLAVESLAQAAAHLSGDMPVSALTARVPLEKFGQGNAEGDLKDICG